MTQQVHAGRQRERRPPRRPAAQILKKDIRIVLQETRPVSARRSVHAVCVIGQQQNDIHISVYKHDRLYKGFDGQ